MEQPTVSPGPSSSPAPVSSAPGSSREAGTPSPGTSRDLRHNGAAPVPGAQERQQQAQQNRPREYQYGRDEGRPSPDGSRDPEGHPRESEEQREERRRWQLKASGREWDLGEEEVVKYAQKGIDADQKWQEAARMRESAQRLITALRDDPMSVLTNPKLGIDFEKVATDYLAKKLEREMMDPNERRAIEAEERLKTFEEREAEAQARMEAEQREAEDYEYQVSVDRDIRQTLSQSGLPLTEFTYDSMIKYMQKAMKAGYRDVTPEGVLPYVKRDFQRSQEQIFALPEDQMLGIIGEKGLNRIQEAYIKKVKGEGAIRQPSAPPPPREAPLISKENGTMEDWRQRLRRSMGVG